MNDSPQQQALARWLRLVMGLGWFLLISLFVSGATNRDLLPVFAVVSGGGLGLGVLGLVWLSLWAQARKRDFDQFHLGSILFLTVYVAAFAASVRWLAGGALETEGPWIVLPIGVFCLFAAILSVPIVLGMLESLLRGAVWCMRQPVFRRLIRALRRR